LKRRIDQSEGKGINPFENLNARFYNMNFMFFRIHILSDGTILGAIYVVAVPGRFSVDFRVHPVLPTDGDSWGSVSMDICQVSSSVISISLNFPCI
jgi:hypothetical protein